MKNFIRDAKTAHIDVLSIQLSNIDALPERLRAVEGKIDAIWLTPDPQIVTPGSFATLREFARADRVMFYAPTAALVDAGATASVAANPRESGRTAALAAKRLLAGGSIEEMIYPENAEIVVNKAEMDKVVARP
jgi:ABC-type uncharacterized transport system substrate-binding protein